MTKSAVGRIITAWHTASLLQGQVQKSGKLYTPKGDSSVLQSEGLLGEGVSIRPNYGDVYRVFVQSMGSGKRHVQANTFVIYEEPVG